MKDWKRKKMEAQAAPRPPETILARIAHLLSVTWFMGWTIICGGYGLYQLDSLSGKSNLGSALLCIAIAIFTAWAFSRMLVWRRHLPADAKTPH